MSKKIIARVRGNDNQNDSFIYIIADTETYQIEASNGDELPTLNVDNVEDLFRDVYTLWGQWNTFEWLAAYDENENVITDESFLMYEDFADQVHGGESRNRPKTGVHYILLNVNTEYGEYEFYAEWTDTENDEEHIQAAYEAYLKGEEEYIA